MARYSAGFTKAAPATGTFASQIRTTSSKDIRVWEVGCFCSTAVALSVGLIRSLTVGATFTTITPVAEDTSAGTATALVDTAITTQPTITANTYLRKAVLPATIGAGIVWSFPMGLVVPVSAGLLLWNFGGGTGPAIEGYWTYDE
jgi:hypothetical protein